MKYVIIGGVAGGATAAARLRRIDEQAEIILLEKGKYISYANCGLPYYIGGVIAEREKLLVQTPASFGKRFRIDVRVENEVIAIDPEKKTLTIRKADGKEYEETYDKLLLSPGANPVKPPLEGIDSEGIFTLRNVEDTDRIKAYITDKQVKRAVVVGAGFIGLEMAENLHHAGVAVSVVEMGNQVMAPIDFSMAAPIHRHLIEKGVSLYLEEGVTRFRRTEEGITVFLKSGKTIPADMVLLSIGVRPATALAQQAGLELGETGGIRVDEHLETSVKDIYAVGDAIEYPHPLTGKPWLNYLANPANRQGRIVADNMALGNTTDKADTAMRGVNGTTPRQLARTQRAATDLAQEVVQSRAATPKPAEGKKTKEQKRAEAQARAALNKKLKGVRNQLKKIETELDKKRARYDELMELMASEELYADQDKFNAALGEYNGLKQELPKLEDEWLELSTQIEEETARELS